MSSLTERQSRRNGFDFLRLAAALAVVVQHSTAHLDADFLWVSPGSRWWFYDGVPAFFILSGYFVYRSAEVLRRRGDSWSDFFVNRGLRIVPAIWTYLIATALLVVAVGAAAPGDLMGAPGLIWIASTLALVPVLSPGFLDNFGVGVINGSLWTIPVEVSFYLIVPLLVIGASRVRGCGRAAGLLVAGVALGAAALSAVLSGSLPGKLLDITFLPHLGFFALGIWWYRRRDTTPLSGQVALATFALYLVIALSRPSLPDSAYHPLTLAAAVPLSYTLIYIGSNAPSWMSRLTDRVGDLSFGAYIWHMPLINLMLWYGLDDILPGQVAVALAILLTLVAAWLSWHLVERRALGLKRRSSRA